ncbi:multicopper oxidase family protein [Streptomyces sp. NPDC048577]|uniref:multicopper oxidase family protein n=1 Tax=Streptomyces sp. NPDC048577 TaxID=3157209 RepID=UPI0034325974
MVENLFEQNLLWAVLAAVFWGFAARGARTLATRRTTRSLRRRARLGLVLVSVCLLLLALRVGLAVALGGAAEWRAAADFLLFAAVPLTLAGSAVAALALPAYLRVVRLAVRPGPAPAAAGRGPLTDAAGTRPVPVAAGREAASATAGASPPAAGPSVPPVAGREPGPAAGGPAAPAALRQAAADPRLVVPVRACFAVTVVTGALTLHPPAPSWTGPFLLELALLAVVAGALLLFQQRRRTDLAAPGWKRPSWPRRAVRPTALLGAVVLLCTAGGAVMQRESRLPATLAHHQHRYDTGGGPDAGRAPARDLTTLAGPRDERPAQRITLTATSRTMTLTSGEKVHALAFNGSLPGPELHLVRGELTEVVLVNENVDDGVTLHWHGVDVPNAEDGVAGVTQDAVRPGGRHVYRIRPTRAGTFWYHSHQQSSTVVVRGLFGALVVEEPGARPAGVDRTVVAHAWPVADTDTDGGERTAGGPPRGSGGALSGRNGLGGLLRTAFGDDTRRRTERVAAGTPVRLRLVNADNCPRTYSLAGTPFRVAAIDGNEVNRPTELTGRQVRVAGGGRIDLAFVQPAAPVHLTVVGDANASAGSHGFEGCGEDGAYGAGRVETASLLLVPPGVPATEAPAADGPLFDPLHYGTPAAAPFGPDTRYDREFHLVLGNSVGFFDGRPMMLWTINNAVYPDIPALLVAEGDTVRTTFVNRSLDDHPMHLHGHRILVLSRDGERATGSPWWTDTLNVAPGERYEVAFRADNPGVWMDHCHNLDHARDGMVLHLAYDGVTSPYRAGRSTGNVPE